MDKYLAYNAINSEYEECSTIEEAREYLEESFLDREEGYHPDLTGCKIYKLVEIVEYDEIDSKDNYKYEHDDDIPEEDEESEAWPYDNAFDEIWKHRFEPVKED